MLVCNFGYFRWLPYWIWPKKVPFRFFPSGILIDFVNKPPKDINYKVSKLFQFFLHSFIYSFDPSGPSLLILGPAVKQWTADCQVIRSPPVHEPPLEVIHLVCQGVPDLVTQNRSKTQHLISLQWWHQMETFSALLALCEGNSPVNGEFPSQRPVTRSFDISFDLRLKKKAE